MIEFITNKQEFVSEKERINQIFDLNIDLPENMFDTRFKYFKGFEFDVIYSERFFNGLKSFLYIIGDANLLFYTILPCAENYFFKHFNKYSIAKIDNDHNYDDYINFLNADPGNPADALITNGETIAMYSKNKQWALLGSKDCEIAILGFTDTEMQNTLIDNLIEIYITDVKTRINLLDEMLHFKQPEWEFYNKLESNYKDRQ